MGDVLQLIFPFIILINAVLMIYTSVMDIRKDRSEAEQKKKQLEETHQAIRDKWKAVS